MVEYIDDLAATTFPDPPDKYFDFAKPVYWMYLPFLYPDMPILENEIHRFIEFLLFLSDHKERYGYGPKCEMPVLQRMV
jgi:hypothetical protein